MKIGVLSRIRIENAVLESSFQDILVSNYLDGSQKEVQERISAQSKDKKHLIVSLKNEIKVIERQFNEIVSQIPQMQHKHPLVEKLDALEAERIALNKQLEYEKPFHSPPLSMPAWICWKGLLRIINRTWSKVSQTRKKTSFNRSLKEHFDEERLEIIPSYP